MKSQGLCSILYKQCAYISYSFWCNEKRSSYLHWIHEEIRAHRKFCSLKGPELGSNGAGTWTSAIVTPCPILSVIILDSLVSISFI